MLAEWMGCLNREDSGSLGENGGESLLAGREREREREKTVRDGGEDGKRPRT
jgi:hypothetical protein